MGELGGGGLFVWSKHCLLPALKPRGSYPYFVRSFVESFSSTPGWLEVEGGFVPAARSSCFGATASIGLLNTGTARLNCKIVLDVSVERRSLASFASFASCPSDLRLA